MRHLSYTQRFREAAEKHIDFKHTATEMHFGRLILSGWPFTKLDIDEFLTAQKVRMRFPLLLLESYDARYQQNDSDNIRKLGDGAIIILDKPTKEYDSRDEVLDRCERQGEEILGFVIEEYRKRRLKFDANTFSSEKVGPVGDGLWGVRFNFQLPEVANNPLAFQPDKFSN